MTESNLLRSTAARSGPLSRSQRRDRLLETVYGLGFSDVARLRGWYRRLTLAAMPTGQRWRWWLAALTWPFVAARMAVRTNREWGRSIAKAHGVSRLAQAWSVWRLALAQGVPPEDGYYRFRCFLPERRTRAADYIPGAHLHTVLMALARRMAPDELALLDDKLSFHAWCRAHELPTPPLLRVYRDGCEVESNGKPLRGDLFSKPADDRWGRGAARWREIDDGIYLADDGRVLPIGDVLAALAAQSRDRPVLLQPQLRNDPQIADLSSALATVRIVTGRGPGGEPRIYDACFRMARNDAPVDNLSSGGIGAAVHLATGVLGVAMASKREYVQRFSRHPETDARIAGRPLPHWREAKQLVLWAHGRVERLGSLGWDVAVTPRGPVLLEANVSWDAAIQVVTGVALGRTRVVEDLLGLLRGEFGSDGEAWTN